MVRLVPHLLVLAASIVSIVSPGAARGAPQSRQRVVLADPDPELRHAMEQALAPWRLELIIEGPAPADASMAQERADADTARFVVWRDGEQLVVYDRELGTIERRDSRSGVLDPPTAAAAALTIKTMMRLPPPPPLDEAPAPRVAPAAGAGIELRLQAGIATRIARSDDTAASARIGGGAAIRPWPSAGWRFGLAFDGGTATDVSRASFKGTWRDWAAFGLVSWTYARGAWELEPHAGVGVRYSILDGDEMGTPRSETTPLAALRGGVWARWRLARWTIGATVAVDDAFGTPTYTKISTPAVVFQVPGIGAELGAVLAVDL